jgi:hypothetical protein
MACIKLAWSATTEEAHWMTKSLQISNRLLLPIDAVTQKIAVLGMTGSGKSYCVTKLAEMMLDARAQVIFLDPKGEAWGLRLMADGKTPGYPIPVFGGEHADLPLRPDMGARIVDLLIDGDYSAILDVSEFISSELARFGYDFATRLFERKKQRPAAMCLMIDECQDFIPQNPSEKGFEPKMLHAFERVGKQLRSKGVGMVLIGQRPQEINKKVLNMCECWFAFQMTGLQERETMEKLIKDKDREEASRLRELLPTLEIGNAHVWSPRWLKVSDTFLIREKKTFDSSATPEVGARQVQPRKLSPVDVDTLRESMQEVVRQVEENDPALLRRRIRELSGELEKAQKAKPEVETRTIEKPVITDEQMDAFKELTQLITGHMDKLGLALRTVENALQLAWATRQAASTPAVQQSAVPARTSTLRVAPPSISKQRENVKRVSAVLGEEITAPQQRILDALAAFEILGHSEVSKSNVAVFSEQSPKSSGFTNNLGRLRSMGLIDYPTGGRVCLTSEGRARAQSSVSIPDLASLHRSWFSKLSTPKVKILQALISRYPYALSKQALAELADQSATSSGYTNNLGSLRSLGLIDYPRGGYVAATELLFPEGL